MLTIKRIDQADAQTLIEGARKKATEIGVPMCIAIADDAGHLVAFERMDGGKITSTTIAIDKAFTAAAAKRATHVISELSQPGKPIYGINTSIGGRMMIVGGGLPVTVDGEIVGSIGISSGTPTQDVECAQAGIDHFEKSLV